MDQSLTLATEEVTARQAELLAAEIKSRLMQPDNVAGILLALLGGLGAGKTTFTRYLAKHLGSQVPVSSPTYVLQHEYPCADGICVDHWDLYRVTSVPEELFEEVPTKCLRIVEWADKFPESLAGADYTISLVVNADGRIMTIKKP